MFFLDHHVSQLPFLPLPKAFLRANVKTLIACLLFNVFCHCKFFYVSGNTNYGNNIGPHGEREEIQIFIQKLFPVSDQLFLRTSSTGERLEEKFAEMPTIYLAYSKMSRSNFWKNKPKSSNHVILYLAAHGAFFHRVRIGTRWTFASVVSAHKVEETVNLVLFFMV